MSIFKRQPPKHKSTPHAQNIPVMPDHAVEPKTLPAPEPLPVEQIGALFIPFKDHGSPLDNSHCHTCGEPSIAGGSVMVDGKTGHFCPRCWNKTRATPDGLAAELRAVRRART